MLTSRFRSLALLATATAAAAVPAVAASVLAGEPVVVVRHGDTLSELSLEHGVAVEEIVAHNRLADPNRIYVGQILRLVPTPDPAPAAPAQAQAPAPAASAPRSHVVAQGENLTWIARRYG
ncbi:MAG: LysM peptidoglycan-binding domain-containing protein, partial [Thermoleophilaceae bacterium]